MEFFANDTRVIHRFARHYKTGEKIPKELLERLIASKSLFAASELQTQVKFKKINKILICKKFFHVFIDLINLV